MLEYLHQRLLEQFPLRELSRRKRDSGSWGRHFAFGIGALDAGDTLGVVPAKNELLNHLGHSFDTESAVDDSVFAFVLFNDALKMLNIITSQLAQAISLLGLEGSIDGSTTFGTARTGQVSALFD
jgi:hypothetical protein